MKTVRIVDADKLMVWIREIIKINEENWTDDDNLRDIQKHVDRLTITRTENTFWETLQSWIDQYEAYLETECPEKDPTFQEWVDWEWLN